MPSNGRKELILTPQETKPEEVEIDMTQDMLTEIAGMTLLGAKLVKRNSDGKAFLALKTDRFWEEDRKRCYFIVAGDQSLTDSGIFFPCDLTETHDETGEYIWSVLP